MPEVPDPDHADTHGLRFINGQSGGFRGHGNAQAISPVQQDYAGGLLNCADIGAALHETLADTLYIVGNAYNPVRVNAPQICQNKTIGDVLSILSRDTEFLKTFSAEILRLPG